MYWGLEKLLNIRYPIIQGGMAWVSDATLAAAVSNAGGLGVIAAGNAPASWVQAEIKKARQLTVNPIGVNVMLLSPYVEEIAHVVAAEKVDVIITGAGNPGVYLPLWQNSGLKVIPVVASVALARRLARRGVDAVICEGTEAGGHVGTLTTMVLVPQVVDALDIPVIAAGGIADGRGVVAARALGACGVQIGTRFLVATECAIHPAYKECIIKASARDAVVTGRRTGHPVRMLKNRLWRQYVELEQQGAAIAQLEELGKGRLYRAAREGDVREGSVMAGQIAGLVNKSQSCQQIISEIMMEVEQIISSIRR